MAAITFLFLLPLISFVPAVVTGHTVFDFELVHRDSPKSPLYNSSATPFDRLQAAALRSVNRASYLATRIATKTSMNFELGLHFDVEFLMSFSMGSPNPQAVWGVVDTGSNLNWVNCVGCQCFNKTATLFNASASLSYNKVTCNSGMCSSFSQGHCSDDAMCQYHYSYGDGSYIDGILSTDTFRFFSLDTKQFTYIPNIAFGCNFRSLNTKINDLGSFIGLGPWHPSLMTQLYPKYIDPYFSYCLNRLIEGGLSSRLFLGRGKTAGQPTVTKLATRDSYYAVQLNAISVPGEFDEYFTRRSRLRTGNIIFDSGTVVTMLDTDVVDRLVRDLTDFVSLRTVNPIGQFKLCFYVSSTQQEEKLPGLMFTFQGELGKLWVRPENLFLWANPHVKCMMIVGTKDIQIFGHVMQQNLLVGHDLEKGELNIIEKDCSKLYEP